MNKNTGTDMKFYTLEEITDKHIGKIGTPARDAFEAEVEAALIGSKIKEARNFKISPSENLGKELEFKHLKYPRSKTAET